MPYILAPLVTKNLPGLWAEGAPYSTETVYDICSTDPGSPPVHYEKHQLKPHSICHFDAPGHIIPKGKSISDLLRDEPSIFYGSATVVSLPKPRFTLHSKAPSVQCYEVQLEELKAAIQRVTPGRTPEKLLITFDGAEPDFYARPDRALVLSLEAAEWLVSCPGFNLFGTIWKSTDFQPGSRDRPIHKELFKKAGILECLDLSSVPEGKYFLSAFPIPLEGATESPCCPVLFTEQELGGK